MYGSHLSVAGGMYKAVNSAVALGFDTVQVFTHAPAMWAVKKDTSGKWVGKPLADDVCSAWGEACSKAKYAHTVVHDSYLINLASADDELYEKSISAFAAELARAEQIGVPYLVTHPGAHLGSGEDVGLKRVAKGLDEVHRRVPKAKALTCLEITAGQGTSLGYKLEHLAEIISLCKAPERLAVCLDTAHLLAAGYDFRGRKYAAFKKQLRALSLEDRVKVWHLNDSKKDLGTRVDRHDHIGKGFVGLEGFRPIVRDKAWKHTPKILETAKEKHEDGREWDLINLETLKSLE